MFVSRRNTASRAACAKFSQGHQIIQEWSMKQPF